MNNFKANYDKILEIFYTEIENFLKQIRPKLKDIELIAMNLTSEYMSTGLNVSYREIPDRRSFCI